MGLGNTRRVQESPLRPQEWGWGPPGRDQGHHEEVWAPPETTGELKTVQGTPELGGRDGGTPRTGSAPKERAQDPQYGLSPPPSRLPLPTCGPLTVSCVAVPRRWRIRPRQFCQQRCEQPPAATAPAPGTAPHAAGRRQGGTATAGGGVRTRKGGTPKPEDPKPRQPQ